jgi:hypothetical protein
MADNYTKSDAVDIKTLKLFSADGKKQYDLTAQVAEFSVYEDIMYPVTRAEFTVIDAVDILTSFPIIGEETIEVEFGTPGFDITCFYRFHVNSVNNQTVDHSAKSRSYIIRASSEEFIFSNASLMTGKIGPGHADELVAAVLQRVTKKVSGKPKTLAIERTKGLLDILVSRLKPFQVIDMIRKRSVSEKYVSSSYVFFENKRGFNFCTIEFLLDQLKDNVNDKVFFYDTVGNSDAKNMNTRNVLSLKNITQVNNTKKMTGGGLHNSVKRFDLMTGDVTQTTYKNNEQQHKFKAAKNTPIGLNTTHFEQTHTGDEPSSSLLVPHSSHLPENYIDASMGAKHAFIIKMGQNIYQAHVNGDTALTAGDIITINIPNPTGDTGGSKDSRLTSGNYLISKLRHMIINNNAGQKSYTVSMELIKGFNEDHS